MRILIVPGIGGSDVRHWQSLWQSELHGRAHRIEPASWGEPDFPDWSAAISRGVTPGTVIVAHSLGCLAATAWLVQSGQSGVVGAFLVAPPDPSGSHFPPQAASFPLVKTRLPVPSVVVASSDDPFATADIAEEMATSWGADFVDAGPAGHINSESGLGGWEAGRGHLNTFLASLEQPPHAERFLRTAVP